jgi:hypothetical protein
MQFCLLFLAPFASGNLESLESVFLNDTDLLSDSQWNSANEFSAQTDPSTSTAVFWGTTEGIVVIVSAAAVASAVIVVVCVWCFRRRPFHARFGEAWQDPMRYVMNSELLDDEIST